MISDGLSCFPGVTVADCQHQAIVVGERKPRELPELNWINTVLGNVKTSLAGAYHGFKFGKSAARYLAAVAYCFNRRFRLDRLLQRLLLAAISCPPCSEAHLRGVPENAC